MTSFGLDPDADSGFVDKKKKRQKKSSESPTERTLKLLKDRGYTPWIAEHYNAFSKRRHDLYNFIDVVGLHPKETGVLAVQTTSGANLAARIQKAELLSNYWKWLASGNDVEFHGWRKLKSGWEPKIVRVSYKDMF